MADTLKNKVSPHIQTQLPEFVQTDHPLFTLFLKYYYEFLEAGELVLSGSNNYLVEETITKNYILEESGEKVVLEDSVGKFTVGETITGATSGFTARILVDDFDTNKRLFITSQQKFIVGETITGSTSGATSTVVSYRGNPVQNIQQLLDYADVDNTVYAFLDKFKDSFMESLPNTFADGLSKRKLIKNIKEMYSAKGTENGHKLFFRILFNEEPTIIYPRDNMLRVSNGQWSSDKVLRITGSGTSDFANAVGQLVTGGTSGATAIIGSVIKFREGSSLVQELNLDSDSVSGVFVSGENVTATDTSLDLQISGVVKSIVTGANITTGGAYYEVADPVYISGAGGSSASARVESIGSGSIDEIMIENGGSGYSVGDQLTFDISNTEGKDVVAKVSVVGGSFLLEQLTSPDQIITEDNESIITEDSQYIRQEETVGETDALLLENGDTIILEEETFNDLGVSSEIGEITRIKMVNRGNGFVSLPTVIVSASSSGSGANLHAISTVSPMVGAVTGISITNFGLNYSAQPTFNLNRKVILKNTSGSFVAGDTLTSHEGTVVNYNTSTQILEINTSVSFNRGDVITTVTGATATVHQSDFAKASSTVGTVGETVGQYVTDRGKVSESSMKIQDSFYYQDYSYVVRIGESINQWRESVRRSVHPAGWNVFGEVSFATQVSAAINNPAAGRVTDSVSDDTFTPELASTFTNLFTVIFTRRLGTSSQGSVNARANLGNPFLSDITDGERDVTLTSAVFVELKTGRGSHLTGPTLENLAKYAFGTPPLTNSSETTLTYGSGASETQWIRGDINPNNPNVSGRIYRGTYNDGTYDIDNGTNNDGAYYTIGQFGNI